MSGTDSPTRSTQIGQVIDPFRLLVDTVSDDALFMVDDRGIVTTWNAGAERLHGYAVEEMVGQHVARVLPVLDPARGDPENPWALARAAGRHEFECVAGRRDGAGFRAHVALQAMRDPGAAPMGFGVLTRDLTRRHPDGAALRVSEARYRVLFEHAPIGILYADERGTYLDANERACAMLGYTRAELVGRSGVDIVAPDEVPHIGSALREIHDGRDHRRQWWFRRKDGSRFIGDVVATAFPDGSVLGMMRDVTVQRQHEAEVDRLSRLYAALSHVNQAIVWTPTRDALFQKVCQALVDHGGFRMAWIGWHDPRTHRLVPAASWGDADGFVAAIDVYVDDRPEGRGPSGTAFRTGQPCVSNDMLLDATTGPWREQRDRHGLRSSAAFPVFVSGTARGTLNVYGAQPDIFHDREVALLAEAAADLSFALDNFERDDARHRAERAALNQQRFADTMIESMPGVVYLYDADGRFRRWNRNFETVSGYSSDEIAGMHPLDFFRGADRAVVQVNIDAVFASGEAAVEAAFAARDGSLTPYFFTGRRVEFEGRVCLVGVGVDISERQRMEAVLQDTERRFRTLFEQTAAGVVVVDPDSGAVIEANEQAARQLGYTLQEFLRLRADDFVAPDGRGDPWKGLLSPDAEVRQQGEIRHVTRAGQVRDVFVSSQRVELRGRTLVHCVFLDITERKAAAEEREKRERAEAADHIKSAFLATMSHELRTPLNSIVGFTGVLLQGLAGPVNDEQRRQLEMVRTSARHLLALVNDVLDISKIEAGQVDIMRDPFAAARSIDRVVDLVRPSAQKRGIAVRVSIDPDVGIVVSDERRFEQILLNLVGNAIKFTERGEVAIAADVVREPAPEPAATSRAALRVRVIDTGIGIRPEDLAHLFQPFRQIDSGLSRKYEGTGLGLAICARLAGLMGGRIEVESQWGRGSTFSVFVPLDAGAR